MNRLKLASKSFAYSWNLIFESSKFMIFLYFALMLITMSFPLLSAFLLKYVLDALTAATPEMEKVLAVADEAWHELVAIVERQMQQRLAPEEVVWSESVNQAPDKRYPAPEVLTLPTLTKMLENDTFAPYHAQLAPLLERYREVFMV